MQLHEKVDVLYTDVLKGKHVVIIPSVIVAEVCAVTKDKIILGSGEVEKL